MAGLEGLISLIYHEKQQKGSMLCAQHALNNVLQGNYFTAPDLSDIARKLDALEEHYDDANAGQTSTNMDDTGFFSVQVLENALNVWGLNLVRWRSMAMRPYQSQPHTQLAFILNLQQHWFTLRRFGPAFPNVSTDEGHGHWFNLNSFLAAPEWVGKLYLGMVLHQAEQEGYSVFAVTQADPSAPLALPRTEVDEISSSLPEPTSATPVTRLSTNTTPTTMDPATKSSTSTSAHRPHYTMEGFEDEDMELQAVLQATLMGSGSDIVYSPLPLTRSSAPIPGSWPSESGSGPSSGVDSGAGTPTHRTRHRYGAPGDLLNPSLDADRVAESMARNRAIMARMRREQEMAQRELYEEEVARHGVHASAEEDNENEMLRQAITESHELAKVEGHELIDEDQGEEDENEDENEDVDIMADREPEYRAPPRIPMGPSYPRNRVYDDDDEELQRALKASLEAVPQGFIIPNLEGVPTRVPSGGVQHGSMESASGERESQDMDTSSEADASVSSVPSSDLSQEARVVSVDELRKRRLARFGA